MAATPDLDKTLEELRAQIAEINELPDKTQAEIEKIEDVEQEIIDVTLETGKEQKFGEELETTIGEKTAEVERLRKELEEKQAQGEVWKQNYERVVAQRREIEEKLATAKAEYEAQSQANEVLDQRLSKLQQDSEDILELIGPSPLEIEELSSLVDKVKEATSELKEDCHRLNAALREEQARFNIFKVTFAEANVSIDDALDEAGLAKVTAHIQAKLQQLRDEEQASRAEAERIEEQRDQAAARLEELRQRLSDAEKAAAEQQTHNAAMQAELQRLNEQLSELHQEEAAVAARIEEITKIANGNELRQANAQLLSQLNDRQRQVAEANSFEHLQESIISALDLIQTSLAAQNQSLSDEVKGLREQLDSPRARPSAASSTPASSPVRPTQTAARPCLLL